MNAHPGQPARPPSVPTATYRVQLQPGFGFDDVAEHLDHLQSLGVSHVYLSPILQPSPGSTHGYDVVEHGRLNPELGGEPAFERLADALAARGMSAIADVVPNHMNVPRPVRLNRALWSVLRDGPGSPYARWFDVDWSVPDHAVLMPVLGQRIGQVLAAGELAVATTADSTGDPSGGEPVLRYFEQEFPIRPGTQDLPLAQLVDRQWYRLAWWRVASEELNYRRFFDVDTLAAVRVELPDVFAATHAVLLDLIRRGRLSGLRIDHPDGLADPRGYLRRLAAATDGVWVVVEKILEADELLPADWPCAGTTGYDALARIGGLFVDPAGADPLSALLTELTGASGGLEPVLEAAKREVIEQSLHTEMHRLVDLLADITHADIALRDVTRRGLRDALIELLVAFERYRAYVVPGEQASAESVLVVEQAAERAAERLPAAVHDTLAIVCDLVLGRPVGHPDAVQRDAARRRELVVRFQQACGPVMAKGVEDTAFYRWHRLVALNEVGGDPRRFGVSPEEFHAYAARQQEQWPLTMTTLSTHDTKRSEDVRARLAVLAELSGEWAEAVRGWRTGAAVHRAAGADPDPATEYLIWQTLVGTWAGGPLLAERLVTFLTKAVREAKLLTSWSTPEQDYEDAVTGFARAVLADEPLMAAVAAFCGQLTAPARVAVLGQKLVQLTMPGVPDVYQGTELVDLSLVDPDNRRPVDLTGRRVRLARLDAERGAAPDGALDLDAEKLLVTSRALRLRRQKPEWFTGPDACYTPLATSSGNAVAFARGSSGRAGAVTVATRLPVALERHGGWSGHTVVVPAGEWRDLLTGRDYPGGPTRLAGLLDPLPVALLARA